MPSITDFFEIEESGTVQDAWLTTVNLFDVVEQSQRIPNELYDFAGARLKISKVLFVAEMHKLDSIDQCKCGLSGAEHALLKRKIFIFFKLQVDNVKHLVAT